MANTQAVTSRFLLDAAHLLAGISPAVSAELNATRREVLQQNVAPVTEETMACNACGRLLILGWNCTALHSEDRGRAKCTRTRQGRLTGTNTHKQLRILCASCRSITQFTSEKPKRMKSQTIEHKDILSVGHTEKSQPARRDQDLLSTCSASPASPAVVDTGIKKRGRSKKSTLQSLLADRKPVGMKSDYGLDLMDFMKS